MSPEQLEAKIRELEAALRPFAEAWKLHESEDLPVSKRKQVMAMNTSVEDWQRAAEVLSALEVEG